MKDFITKNKTMVIALVAIIMLAVVFFLFKDDIKALFSKKENPEEPKKENESTTIPVLKDVTGYTHGNVEIGKSVYANTDGVKVLFKADATTFRTKNKGEFVGVITGKTTLAGNAFYSLGNGLVVAQNKVIIK